MGYRSDVLIVYHGPKEAVQAFIVAAKFNGHGKAIAEMTTREYLDDFAIGVRFSGVKWYASYADVDTHENLWRFASMFGGGISGSFKRVGEDADDNDDRSFGDADDPCDIPRQITCDYGY